MKKFKPLKPEHKVVRGKEKYASAEEKALGKNVALAYAEEKFEKSLYQKIYKSYNVLKWTQLAVIIGGVALSLLAYILCPNVMVDGTKSLKAYALALVLLIFLVFILPIGTIGASYTIGKLWTKYIKWFRTPGATIPQLYEMLGLEYTDAAVRAAKQVNNKNKNVFKP